MHFRLHRSYRLPVACRDLNILGKVLLERSVLAGSRVTGWFAAAVKDDGAVDWLARPLFKPVWCDGVLVVVEHISGAKAKVPDVVGRICMDTHVFLDPMSDDAARFRVKSTTADFVLKSWFAADVGPNPHQLDLKGVMLQKLADDVKANL